MTDDLLTGIKDIDDQHRVFFAWGNRILMTPDMDRDREAFARAVGFIKQYAAFHFASEEFAMELFDFPGLGVHRMRHAGFTDKAAELEAHARSEGMSRKVQLEIYFLIQDWLPQHILTLDREFAAHVAASGEPDPRLPDAATMERRGVRAPSEVEVRVVRFEGEMTQAELKARTRGRSI
jgi:hemerythrin